MNDWAELRALLNLEESKVQHRANHRAYWREPVLRRGAP